MSRGGHAVKSLLEGFTDEMASADVMLAFVIEFSIYLQLSWAVTT
jgi:hypothetical protein